MSYDKINKRILSDPMESALDIAGPIVMATIQYLVVAIIVYFLLQWIAPSDYAQIIAATFSVVLNSIVHALWFVPVIDAAQKGIKEFSMRLATYWKTSNVVTLWMLYFMSMPITMDAQCIEERTYWFFEYCIVGVQEPISGDGEEIIFHVFVVSAETGDTLDYIRYENNTFLLWGTTGEICDSTDFFDEPILVRTDITTVDGVPPGAGAIHARCLEETITYEVPPIITVDSVLGAWTMVDTNKADPCHWRVTVTTVRPPSEWIRTDESALSLATESKVYMPSAIRPNSPFKDNYAVGPMSPDSSIIVLKYDVFDRWGNLVFRLVNVPINEARWYGRGRGKELDSGVYVYHIQYQDSKGIKTLKGDITLLY